MNINRRNFLQSLGAGGVTLMASPSSSNAADPYEGPLLMTINALGGWDVSNFCDPKGGAMNLRYDAGDIGTAGAMRYAPLDDNAAFFDRFHSQMTLINGIDMRTAGHTEAARYLWSGAQADNNTPCLAALFAAYHVQDSDVPAPYISYGGFSRTGDLVSLTRLGDTLTLSSVGVHERERGIPTESRYVDDFVLEEVYRARQQRHDAAQATELPRFRRQRAQLFGNQINTPLLRRYQDYLPEVDNALTGWQSSAAISLACLKAGVGAAASVYVSDFDTHSDHEALHGPKFQQLLETITFAVDRAQELGILDRLTFIISSEFSRTPEYGLNGGKDHWPNNSMLLMGPGIEGNRVIGATDAGLVPRNLNLETLEVDDAGERLYPGHIHAALREHLGLAEFGRDTGFDLSVPSIPLFD